MLCCISYDNGSSFPGVQNITPEFFFFIDDLHLGNLLVTEKKKMNTFFWYYYAFCLTGIKGMGKREV